MKNEKIVDELAHYKLQLAEALPRLEKQRKFEESGQDDWDLEAGDYWTAEQLQNWVDDLQEKIELASTWRRWPTPEHWEAASW